MTGRRSKRKGYRTEKHCADMFNAWAVEHGLPTRANRGDGTVGEDVYAHVGNSEFRIECKGRKNGQGFVTLLQWMVGSDALYLRADRQEPLIVLRPDALRDMLAEAYESGKAYGSAWTVKEFSPRLGMGIDVEKTVGGQPITEAK